MLSAVQYLWQEWGRRSKAGRELRLHCCNEGGSSGSWAGKSGEVVLGKQDSLWYKGAHVGCGAGGEGERVRWRQQGWNQGWFLCSYWRRVFFKWPVSNAFSCCPLPTWESIEEKCLCFWQLPLFPLFSEAEHKPYRRTQSVVETSLCWVWEQNLLWHEVSWDSLHRLVFSVICHLCLEMCVCQLTTCFY